MSKNIFLNRESIEFAPKMNMRLGKIHECCGPAKIRLAIMLATAMKGKIIWIRPNWDNSSLNIDNISNWFSTERLLLVKAKKSNDLLYCAETALRSGVATLTIVDLPEIPRTTPMRRLKIALKKGMMSRKDSSIIALILTPSKGGASNIESRWYVSALPSWFDTKNCTDIKLKQKWCVSRLFSKTDPPAKWTLETIEFEKEDRYSKPTLISRRESFF